MILGKFSKAWACFAAIVALDLFAKPLVFRTADPSAVPEDFDDTAPQVRTNASYAKGPKSTSSSIQKKNVPANLSLIDDIILKWNISTEAHKERDLLEKIWNRDIDYKPEEDLIVFFHPMKSGGTSLSMVLESMEGIVPGSDESGHFHFDTFLEEFDKIPLKKKWWESRRVLYSHSDFRGYAPEKKPKLGTLLRNKASSQRLRHITMVRDPLAFVSSNFYEWYCLLGQWEKYARKYKLPKSASGENGTCAYSLEDRAKARIRFTEEECKDLTKKELAALVKRPKKRCMAYHNGQADPTPWCASIPAFLASDDFPNYFHNVFADYTHSGREATSADFIYGALEYLGGLDVPVKDGAMMWFGITERMDESMCLFHYQTGLTLVETPTHRIKTCRPTSFWSEADKQHYWSGQELDHAVYYAGNAILDLELAKMRQDLWSRVLQGKATVESMDFTSLKCMGPKPTE